MTTTERPSLGARMYLRMSATSERHGQAETRARLLRDLSGSVVEVGAGQGLNFRHYPEAVTEVVAVEPEPALRRLAEQEAARAAVPIRVLDGVAEALPGDDGEYDAAVATLVLCTVPDQAQALGEIRRVLKPGGELRYYEHVRANHAGFARFQRGVDVMWPYLGGGCHVSRATGPAIEAAGFELERSERFVFQPSVFHAPAKPHILGVARNPR
jgi:ubiquinone/menaquinone biosynthesis C-methylase UbiE